MRLADSINASLRQVPPWLLYVVGPLPGLWWFWLGLTGGLGVEPIKELEHLLGEFALQLLILGLAITPTRRRLGLNFLRFRRAIGVIAFFYVLAHLLVWLLLDIGIWSQIWADIVKRPYITIGMAGFVLLLPLAVTSNDLSVRRIGAAAWRRLHRLVYPAVLLGGIHYLMLVKGWQLKPMIYLGVIVVLIAARAIPQRSRIVA